ncbi:hypothetical protein ABZ499_23430 [Streptomyces sp. NPDC019990]|uniref:hypothetical protein n=1 Tax=Streptomyces sp. NPDC019990 TaxID=3154693 RepID=UPI0033CFC665
MVHLGGDYPRTVNASSGKVVDVANRGTPTVSDARRWSWLSTNCRPWQLVPTAV